MTGWGGLRQRIDYTWTGSSWYPQLLHPLHLRRQAGHPGARQQQHAASEFTPEASDLSGSLEGAGGIGGLLARFARVTPEAIGALTISISWMGNGKRDLHAQ